MKTDTLLMLSVRLAAIYSLLDHGNCLPIPQRYKYRMDQVLPGMQSDNALKKLRIQFTPGDIMVSTLRWSIQEFKLDQEYVYVLNYKTQNGKDYLLDAKLLDKSKKVIYSNPISK